MSLVHEMPLVVVDWLPLGTTILQVFAAIFTTFLSELAH
jgi:hypothetical protein